MNILLEGWSAMEVLFAFFLLQEKEGKENFHSGSSFQENIHWERIQAFKEFECLNLVSTKGETGRDAPWKLNNVDWKYDKQATEGN